jgi:hypothetical protein
MFAIEVPGIGEEFLLLVNLAKSHEVDVRDKTMPIVEFDERVSSAYLVCSFEQVVCQVGLVRYNENRNRYKVVSKQKIFRDSILNFTAGKNSLLAQGS